MANVERRAMRRIEKRARLLLGAIAFVLASGHFVDAALARAQAVQQHKSKQSAGADIANFSQQEWAIIKTLSPLPALPVDKTNKHRDSPAAALLGARGPRRR